MIELNILMTGEDVEKNRDDIERTFDRIIDYSKTLTLHNSHRAGDWVRVTVEDTDVKVLLNNVIAILKSDIKIEGRTELFIEVSVKIQDYIEPSSTLIAANFYVDKNNFVKNGPIGKKVVTEKNTKYKSIEELVI